MAAAAIGRIFHLNGNRHDSEIFFSLLFDLNRERILVQNCCIQTAFTAGGSQFIRPLGNADLGFTGSNRQTRAAHIGTGGRIREIVINNVQNFRFAGSIGRQIRTNGVIHSILHGSECSGQNTECGGYFIVCLLFFRQFGIEIIRSIRGFHCTFLYGQGFLQCSIQLSVLFICNPCEVRKAPVICGSNHFFLIQLPDLFYKGCCGIGKSRFCFGNCTVSDRSISRYRGFRFGHRSVQREFVRCERHTFGCGFGCTVFQRINLCRKSCCRHNACAHDHCQKQCQKAMCFFSFHI